MLSLCCVLVCVVEQLSNSAAPAAAMLAKKIVDSFIVGNLVLIWFHFDLVYTKSSRTPLSGYLKIHAPLDKGATQVSFIGKAARDKVGPQPAPSGLQPEPSAYLKFKAALKLIASILA